MPEKVNGSIKRCFSHKADEAIVFTTLQARSRHFSHVCRHRKPDEKTEPDCTCGPPYYTTLKCHE